jgi:hypothetical protein
MPNLPSEQPRDPRGRYTRNLALADDSDTIVASSSPNVPGALPHSSSPPPPKATYSSSPTNFSIRAAERRELLVRFKDDFSPRLLSTSVPDFNTQLTSATACDEDQQPMDTTPIHQGQSAQPDTPPTPIHSRIYSFDQPFPVSHANQHPSDSEDDAPTLLKHQNPPVATSKRQPISTLSFNTPAPQTTSSNINTPALCKAQNNKMSAITGPAAMPAALSHHAPYFSGEGGESLNDFLREYEELADDHRLTERQKVDWVIRYVACSQQDL